MNFNLNEINSVFIGKIKYFFIVFIIYYKSISYTILIIISKIRK
jgi:hypothetical protein